MCCPTKRYWFGDQLGVRRRIATAAVTSIILACGSADVGGAHESENKTVSLNAGGKPERERESEPKKAPAALDARSALKLAQAVANQIKGARVIAVAPNGSMRPIFEQNAYLVAEPVRYDDLHVGDLVTYEHPKLHITVVQRVAEKRGATFWTQDRKSADMAIAAEQELMRVFTIIYVRDKIAGNTGTKDLPAPRPAKTR